MARSPLIIFKDNRYITVLVIFAFILIAAICNSRSFVLGYWFSLFLFATGSFKVLRKKRYLFSLLFISAIFLYLVTFLIKTDSSSGRLLVFKISLGMLYENYITGIGLGNFAVAYGDSQIKYFERGNYSTKELLLADNTTHAFNDYLQFFIETGISGLIIILIIGLSLYKSCSGALKQHTKRPFLLIMAICQIIAISCAALFTHVFEHTIWQFLTLISAGITTYYNQWIKPGYLTGIILLLLTLSTTYKYGRFLLYHSQYKTMDEARELLRSGYVGESAKLFEALYPQLNGDNRYLSDYAAILMATRKYPRAERILSILIKKENSSSNYNMLADCYQQNGKLKEAELTYLKAINRVPNRFTSRFNLFNFYLSTGNRSQAEIVGRQILNLPVKVESVMVDGIKKIVKNNL